MTRSPNVTGAIYMTVSMAAFTFNDACVKLAATDVPLFQLVFLRGLLTTIMLTAVVWAMGRLSLTIPRQDLPKVIGRTIAEIASLVCFLLALINMPLANVTAILGALPLTVTLAAAVFLREPIGWKRMLAILVGFVGVLLIVQPGTDGFNVYALLALLAVVFITARDLFTRQLSSQVPSMTVAVITAAAVCVFGGAMSVTETWQPLDLRSMALIAAASVFIIAAYVFSIMVMRVGDIGYVAPFRYTSLVFALVLGWAAFGDWPNALTLIGGGIVVATGLFTLLREQRVARRVGRSPASLTATAVAAAPVAGPRTGAGRGD
jgi:S-adenosylmethionine uptake transporter